MATDVRPGGQKMVTVAASQTTQALGTVGAKSDVLSRLIIIPATTSPGSVLLRDGTGGSDITIFPGGASSVSNLAPIVVSLGATSLVGPWKLTTGVNVSVIAIGNLS